MSIKPIHKATMLKHVREHKMFVGYIAPSDVNAYHITDGWRIGRGITITIGRDGLFYVVCPYSGTHVESYRLLSELIPDYQYYNCHELGKRVRFWEKVK